MSVEIKVPEMGESITEATIASWSKSSGEAVEADEILVELETDKVTLEIPAPASGVLGEIKKEAGATVTVAEIIGLIEEGNGAAPKTADRVGAEAQADDSDDGTEEEQSSPSKSAPAKSAGPRNETLPPAVRKLIDENDLDPAAIDGTGKNGQITKEDVLNYMKDGSRSGSSSTKSSAPTKAPAPAKSQKPTEAGEGEEVVPMTRLRQTIANRLVEAQQTAAILTTFNEVDLSGIMEVRKKYKEKFKQDHEVGLGFMSFFTKACVAALKEFPAVNAEIRGTDIVYKNYYHVGVAVGGPKGLVVPVVRDVDQMSFAEIEKEIGRLAGKVKDGSISLPEMQGGTFTISNGGVYGSMMSTPILNAPQTGILGMHNIVERPVAVNGEVVIRPMMYIALSYDHRLIDGREAVLFLVRIKQAIEDPMRMLLEV